MEETEKERLRKKEITEMKTFTVSFALEEIQENISINTTFQSSKEQILNQSFKLHSEGNILEAKKYYQILIDQGFKNHRIYSNYGVILKNLGKLKEAESYQRKAIKLKPDFAEAHSNLGNILKVLGKLKEAEGCFRKAIELNTHLSDAHCNLGNVLITLGNLKEAEVSTRKAIELNPGIAEAHSNLGGILLNLGNLQEAEVSSRKAIELNPNYADAHYHLGTILLEIGNLQEAEASTRKAIELNPNYADAHYNLGNILENQAKIEEAIIHWKNSVELNPDKEKAIITLANFLCVNKEYDTAIKYLSKNKSNSCQSIYLSCLLSLDRQKDFDQKYKELSTTNACNANIGGIVEHAKIIYEKDYQSPFCNEAMQYIYIDKINEDAFSTNHLNELIMYNKRSEKVNKYQGLLTNGIQTSGNLFSLNYPYIKTIKKALEMKIDQYKQKFKDSGQGFINNWPENYELRSWIISMNSGGFLAPHNHEYGWITGSFYLQVPKLYNHEEAGSIAFSYQSPRYPKKGKNFNSIIKKIESRDIVIFPSSLFHQTIPFESTEERICFVFDLVQK